VPLPHCRVIATNFGESALGSDAEILSAASAGECQTHPKLVRRDLPTPAEHGQQLFEPAFSLLPSVWNSNLARVSINGTVKIAGVALSSLQTAARRELLQLATDFSARYQDAPMDSVSDSAAIVMTGHQPELFHPGVWIKNFVLSQLAQQFPAIAINLIIDNDLCTERALRIPTREAADPTRPAQIVSCRLDPVDSVTPYEGAAIKDFSIFSQAGQRIATLVKPYIADPIIEPLWPQVMVAIDRRRDSANENSQVNFGEAIAAGRHRLERRLGLKTLELPLSKVVQTESFSQFAWAILGDATRFSEIHNRGLLEYRQVHGLRSKTHPFPALEPRGEWVETPFWLMFDRGRRREPLFVRSGQGWLELSDQKSWQSQKVSSAAELFAGIERNLFQIRTRAVTTTLYCRMILADLFIHGIGGGKYDRLTDWIASCFWGIELPQFGVVSATYKLFPNLPGIRSAEIALQKQQLRDLEMNPDRFAGDLVDAENLSDEIVAALKHKREWISGQRSGTPKERHAALAAYNRILKQWAAPLLRARQAQLRESEERHQLESAWASREFSFCLHPVRLMEELNSANWQ
jgi:hypothetical protein